MNLICRIITMKALYLTFPLILLFSCTKANVSDTPAGAEEYGNLRIHFNLESQTATKAPSETGVDDIAVLVYKKDYDFNSAPSALPAPPLNTNSAINAAASLYNVLENCQFYYSGDLAGSIPDVNLKVKEGAKIVVVVANPQFTSQNPPMCGLATNFKFALKDERFNWFTSCGVNQSVTITNNNTSDINITLKRIITKISLTELQVKLDQPYKGKTLTDVKVYLKKAYSTTDLVNGIYGIFSSTLTLDGSNADDLASLGGNSSFISVGNIGNISDEDSFNIVGHNMFCYPLLNSKIMLVVEATLNGMTYYYPVEISANPNEHISLKIKITGPGSTTPNNPYLKGAVVTSLSVQPWTDKNAPDINFTEKFTY